MTPVRLVLAPEVPYSRLASTLESLGWCFVSGPAYPPLVDGEPEFASWRREDDTVVYTCNPVAWLRLVDISAVSRPVDRLALVTQLPMLDPGRVARLVRSRAAEDVLLGILASDVLGLRQNLPAIRAMMHHCDRAVATAAQRVAVSLVRAELDPRIDSDTGPDSDTAVGRPIDVSTPIHHIDGRGEE